MKFKVTMKDPDVLHDAISEAVSSHDFGTTDEDELTAIRDVRHEKITKLCSKWFEYSEYLTVEIDTDAETCAVVNNA